MHDLEKLKTTLLGLDKPMMAWHSNCKESTQVPSSLTRRLTGSDHPVHGYTMIGKQRLDSLHTQLDLIRDEQIPGDLIECGVWRGGAVMFMAAYCENYGLNKAVFAADTFCGLPKPEHPNDERMQDHLHEHLRVPVDVVIDNFREVGISYANVVFVEGMFSDTLHKLQNNEFSLIRADGDMYKSTMDIMRALYPNLTTGGFMIVDDYHCVAPCKQAITDYRSEHDIIEPIEQVDWTCVYWRKYV